MPAKSPVAPEFVRVMRRLRWNQSETARKLRVTPAHINQIVNRKAQPSAAMLQLLKLTAAQQQPELAAQLLGPAARATPGTDLLEQFWAELRRRKLDKLSPAEQAEFVAAWRKILGVPAGKRPAGTL